LPQSYDNLNDWQRKSSALFQIPFVPSPFHLTNPQKSDTSKPKPWSVTAYYLTKTFFSLFCLSPFRRGRLPFYFKIEMLAAIAATATSTAAIIVIVAIIQSPFFFIIKITRFVRQSFYLLLF
jgi:hypothetical protein